MSFLFPTPCLFFFLLLQHLQCHSLTTLDTLFSNFGTLYRCKRQTVGRMQLGVFSTYNSKATKTVCFHRLSRSGSRVLRHQIKQNLNPVIITLAFTWVVVFLFLTTYTESCSAVNGISS